MKPSRSVSKSEVDNDWGRGSRKSSKSPQDGRKSYYWGGLDETNQDKGGDRDGSES